MAALNIEIPRALGAIVNVVTNFLGGSAAAEYWSQLQQPAARLGLMYVLQVQPPSNSPYRGKNPVKLDRQHLISGSLNNKTPFS